MQNYCSKCGKPLREGTSFCSECGAKLITCSGEGSTYSTAKKKLLRVNIPLILVVLVALFWAVRYFGPKVDQSWVIDEACTEVESQVYIEYGEIPTAVRGEIIYQNGQNYIVIVKYHVPGWDWDGSRACHIYGYRKSNCALMEMTNELSYDYAYNAAELKALWAIE